MVQMERGFMDITLEKSLTVPEYPVWRLTVEQYHDMVQTGILTEDDPLELLEGLLITKMTKNPPHSISTQLIRDRFTQLLPAGWFVSDQEPITTLDSEPEPDVMVVRGSRRDYMEGHPSPQDVALVVEVSDATLQRDRTLKLRIYASAGIAVYWILNLPERQLEVYSDPADATYRQQRIYSAAESAPVVIEGREVGQVAVGAVLP